jgi:anti-sigma-K factor RskA
MSDTDPHSLTGAYAADALPDDERRAFAEHLQGCPSCRQEVLELTATTARLASAAAEPAPPQLRSRVLAEIHTVRQLSPSGARSSERDRRTQPWFRQPMGVAASFLLVACLGLAAFALSAQRHASDAEQAAARIAAVATDPHRQVLSQQVRTGGSTIVVAAGGNAVFRADGLTVLPANRSYQLWVMDAAGGARSVAVLGRGTRSHLERFIANVHPGDAIGLTVEPSGGSDRPTTSPVVQVPISA